MSFHLILKTVKDFPKLTVSIVVCELIGLISTPFTITSITTWYAFLHKPPFSPPNWVFGPVWTTLYFLMGVAVYLIWIKGIKKKLVSLALFFFAIQLFFNFLWSALFFGLHSPVLGLLDILALLLSIILTIVAFYKISKIASYILIPYLLWVSFATLLNISIIVLNR
jgi:tryptophan-rich sensory protein